MIILLNFSRGGLVHSASYSLLHYSSFIVFPSPRNLGLQELGNSLYVFIEQSHPGEYLLTRAVPRHGMPLEGQSCGTSLWVKHFAGRGWRLRGKGGCGGLWVQRLVFAVIPDSSCLALNTYWLSWHNQSHYYVFKAHPMPVLCSLLTSSVQPCAILFLQGVLVTMCLFLFAIPLHFQWYFSFSWRLPSRYLEYRATFLT